MDRTTKKAIDEGVLARLTEELPAPDWSCGKSLGCASCDGEFATADEQDAHAKATGHDLGY